MITEKLKQVLEEQEQNKQNNNFYQKVEKIARNQKYKKLQIDISDVMVHQNWKRK